MMSTEKSPYAIDDVFASFLRELHQKYLPLTEGQSSDLLPQLKEMDPNTFALSAVSVDGTICSVGDHATDFTMQSVSKPFIYAMALEDHGEAYVRSKTGVEPTGGVFNSIIQHEEVCKGRLNPMVNMGAVTTTSLIRGETLDARIQRVQAYFSDLVGRPVDFDQAALASRRKLDNINRAIAYLMLSEGFLDAGVEDTVELFAHQCSLSVNCQDLAVMAATLANDGIHPLTGKRIIAAQYIRPILSIMLTSGMYEFSGQWAYRVGIPAKSGLAGAILAVVPGRMGLAAYSPLLGHHLKSVRAVRAIEEISSSYRCHIFSRPHHCRLSGATCHIIRQKGPLKAVLEEVYDKYRDLDTGEIYASEPGLHYADQHQFGICVVSTDGAMTEVGDAQVDYLIQSVSKLFAYGLALEDHGRNGVLKRVDVEPTGDAYNAIIEVQTASKRPHNPMVNTGGIAVTSLIKGDGPAKRLNRILAMYQRYAGRRVFVDAPAFISEQAAGDRNRAISYLLKNFNMMDGDIQQTLDLYLQQCSAIVNCRDLAMMAATLANGGIHPVTGQRALKAEYVRDLLTVMYTCGMYDFAGEWAYNVGLPAKSGVSGCILGVVPGLMGIAVFSRPLDARGNSTRGIKVFEELSERLQLHIFHPHE